MLRYFFRAAGDHIRKGVLQDLAYLAPTLIPVPSAFQADGSDPMISHTAENIMFEVKKNMILGDLGGYKRGQIYGCHSAVLVAIYYIWLVYIFYLYIFICIYAGYTPQSMLPLYVRNTLMEKNGTTPGGDQTYDVMSADRRYSHYIGRPLNRFEPDGDNVSNGQSNIKKPEASATPTKLLAGAAKTSTLGAAGASSLLLKSATSSVLSPLTKAGSPTKASSSTALELPAAKMTKKERLRIAEQERVEQEEQAKKQHRQERRLIHQEMEKAKGLPLSMSLVRLAFKDPLPSLADLIHLDD